MAVNIWFKSPVTKIESGTSQEIVASQHSVNASQLIQNGEVTLFVDSDGEVLAEWPTDLILKTEWEKSSLIGQNFSSLFRAHRLEHHPRSWQRWAEDEDQDLKNQYDSEISIEKIAELHERSVSAITARLLHIGTVHWNAATDS